jgi:hypothetical protein
MGGVREMSDIAEHSVFLDRSGEHGNARGRSGRFYALLRAIFEGALLLVALAAAETLFFGPGTFASFNIHPFWIVVLLVTIQHGLYAGVLTACLASALLDRPVRPPDLDIVDYYFELARLPAQWVSAAVILGIYRQAQIRAETARNVEIAELRAMNERFAEEIARLDEDLQGFEISAAIASPSEPPSSHDHANTPPPALSSLAALRAAARTQIGERFAACAEQLLHCDRARLYGAAADGGFRIVSRESGVLEFAGKIPAQDPRVTAARPVAELGTRDGDGSDPVTIALMERPGEAPLGLLTVPADTIGEPSSAQAEALRLLCLAATEALANASFGDDGLELGRAAS